MKNKTILVMFMALIFTIGVTSVGFPAHEVEKGVVKGTVTELKVIEIELTVKDEKGKETKVNTKETAAFKVGDRVVIKDGKVAKEVKPITGGY